MSYNNLAHSYLSLESFNIPSCFATYPLSLLASTFHTTKLAILDISTYVNNIRRLTNIL